MNQEEFIIKAQSLNGQELIGFAFEIYGKRAAIGTSLQKTGSVIIDLASKSDVEFFVFFVDTLFNYDETLELFEETQQRYGITIDRLTPDPNDIEDLYKNYGQYPFFSSLGRLRCCEIRKRLPLLKKLLDLDVWISGLRADQSDHRQSSAINPLVDWTQEQIDAYIKDNAVPYNKLYDFESPYGEKFREIGCKPCHIPVKDDAPKRAGKWPWEQSHKECGLHIDGDGI
ncbi:MAG: phosphoadenosine phosphosulfate reductase family protein [Planctomycetota bacterium]|jgi:phosphoadenosine phosphosulfate reductase